MNVPKCKLVDVDPTYIVEEEATLLGGGKWESQKAYYQWAISDPQLQPYIKELFKQLILFIALTGFSDVKYNNISLTADGRAALFDVDEKGRSGRENGFSKLLRMIPAAWCDELIKVVEPHISPDTCKALHEELPQIKAKDAKRRESREKKRKFYIDHAITLPTQPDSTPHF